MAIFLKRRQAGLGILEVLLALGIISIAMFGFIGFYVNGNITSARLDQNLELAQLDYALGQIIVNDEACTKAFLGQTFIPTASNNVMRVNFPNSITPLIEEGKTASYGIDVLRSRASFITVDLAQNMFLMTLSIEYDKKNIDDNLKLRTRSLTVPVIAPVVSGARTIQSCKASKQRTAFDIPTITCVEPKTFLTSINDQMLPLCEGLSPCTAYPGTVGVTKTITLKSPRCAVSNTGCTATIDIDSTFPGLAGKDIDAIVIKDAPFSGMYPGNPPGCSGRKKDIPLTKTAPIAKKSFFTLHSTLTLDIPGRKIKIQNTGVCKNPALCGPCIDEATVAVCHKP